MTDPVQLKPCPFCGEAATMVQFKSAWGDGLLTEIGCGSSACALSPVTDEVPAEIAIEAWNRRPTEEAQVREIERLREANRVLWLTVNGKLDSQDGCEIADAIARGEAINWDTYPPAARAALGAKDD